MMPRYYLVIDGKVYEDAEFCSGLREFESREDAFLVAEAKMLDDCELCDVRIVKLVDEIAIEKRAISLMEVTE